MTAPVIQLPTGVDTKPSRIVVGGSFILDQPEKIPAIWGEGDRVLWAEGEGLMIAAGQGSGKTTIAQQLCLAMIGVRPRTLLGLPVRPVNGRILYLAMDRPRQAARSFARMVSEEHRDLLNDHLLVHNGPIPSGMLENRVDLADWVERECEDVSVVVVDSLKDLEPGLEKGDRGALVNNAFQELIARGIDVVSLHHNKKTGDDRSAGIDKIYGSTWLTSGQGSVIQMISDPGDDVVNFHHVKQPAEPVGPFQIQHEHAVGRTTILSKRDAYSLLEQYPDTEWTVEKMAQELYDSSDKPARDKSRRALDKLVKELKAIKSGGVNTGSGKAPAVYRFVSPDAAPISFA